MKRGGIEPIAAIIIDAAVVAVVGGVAVGISVGYNEIYRGSAPREVIAGGSKGVNV